MSWSKLSPKEIERRRLASIAAMKARDQADFDQRYQEHCDRTYWTHGQCCAGCDHWKSEMGNLGRCVAAGIVSGQEVLRCLDISFCSYTPKPGFPLTKAIFYCGKFEDDFDWSTLDKEYLRRINALTVAGEPKPKPHPPTKKPAPE